MVRGGKRRQNFADVRGLYRLAAGELLGHSRYRLQHRFDVPDILPLGTLIPPALSVDEKDRAVLLRLTISFIGVSALLICPYLGCFNFCNTPFC